VSQSLAVGTQSVRVRAREALDGLLLHLLLALLGVLRGLLLAHAGALGFVEDQAGGAGQLVGHAVHAVVESFQKRRVLRYKKSASLKLNLVFKIKGTTRGN